jgi:hypothetical protein
LLVQLITSSASPYLSAGSVFVCNHRDPDQRRASITLRVRPEAPAIQQPLPDVQLTSFTVSFDAFGSGVCVQVVPFQRIARARAALLPE